MKKRNLAKYVAMGLAISIVSLFFLPNKREFKTHCNIENTQCVTELVEFGSTYNDEFKFRIYLGRFTNSLQLNDKYIEIRDGNEYFIEWTSEYTCDVVTFHNEIISTNLIKDGAYTVALKFDRDRIRKWQRQEARSK